MYNSGAWLLGKKKEGRKRIDVHVVVLAQRAQVPIQILDAFFMRLDAFAAKPVVREQAPYSVDGPRLDAVLEIISANCH